MNEYVEKALKRNGVILGDGQKKSAKKKSLSISVKLKKVKSYQKQQEIMCEWAEGWQKDMENTLLQLRRAAMRDDHGEIMHMIDRLNGMCNKRFVGLENAIHIISDSGRDLIDMERYNMKKYSKDDFKSMINDFLADHADEYEDDPLKIEEPEQSDEGCWCCIAEDSKARYALFDDLTGNIQIEYIGTK
nr:MAG TPA: hypothetical protein [Caudoviricetes sp.]